jgi:hypothetical protein
MAIVAPTTKDISGDGSVFLISWNLTTADTTGAPIIGISWADRTALFQSLSWGGATAAIEGSNDGSVYVPLTDIQGVAISKSANDIESIVELTRYVQPRLTIPGTAAAVTVSIVARRATPLRT